MINIYKLTVTCKVTIKYVSKEGKALFLFKLKVWFFFSILRKNPFIWYDTVSIPINSSLPSLKVHVQFIHEYLNPHWTPR